MNQPLLLEVGHSAGDLHGEPVEGRDGKGGAQIGFTKAL